MWDYVFYAMLLLPIIYFVCMMLTEEHLRDTDPVCRQLYTLEDNGYYTVVPQLCTQKECDFIMQDGTKR